MRPPEFFALTNAIDAYLKRTGFHAYCMKCVKGEVEHGTCCRSRNGCFKCDGLTETGCKDKPMPCTLYSCLEQQRMRPDTVFSLEVVRCNLKDVNVYVDESASYSRVYHIGQKIATEMEWSSEQIAALTACTRYIESCN